MKIEHRTEIAAPAHVVYRIYEDVQHWHTWDPDTQRAFLDGPFQVGSRGRLTPTKGRTVPMVLTEADPDKRFTVESKIPFFRMRFEHELVPRYKTTEVIHRVTFSGPLSVVLGPLLARQLDVGLPVTLGRLKALAEARHAA